MDLTYPSEPWHLHGTATAGVFLAPVADLPQDPPPGTRLVTIAGRAVVTTAFFDYREPSPLQYGEVMATVLVRRGWRLRVWIVQIWVDSPASRAGGRELWAIPKELATFHGTPESQMVADDLADVTIVRRSNLPGFLPVAFRIAQQRAARSVVTPVSGRLRLSVGRGRWRFSGAMGWLQGRRPLLTIQARRFALTFGVRH